MAGSRRRSFRTRASWIQWVRRSTHRGAKLASSSNDDGSPNRPVKVVVVGSSEDGGADGSPACVPVFRDGDGLPRSVDKIGEGGGASSISVPKMCDGIGEGGASSTSIPKMYGGIGEGGTSSMLHIPKMCDDGRRRKEPVKLGASRGDGSPERIFNIGRSRLRVNHQGQMYVLDSEDEGIDMEAGLYVPDSEEEEGGEGRACGCRQLCRCARLRGGDVHGGNSHGRAEVALVAESKMVANPLVEVATGVDPTREVASVVEPAGEVVPVVEVALAEAAVQVPMGAAVAIDELHPEVIQRLKGLLYRTCGWSYVIISNKNMERLFIMCSLHIKVWYGFSSPI